MRFNMKTPRRDLVVQIGELVLAVLAAVLITVALNPPASQGMDAKAPLHCDPDCDLTVGEN